MDIIKILHMSTGTVAVGLFALQSFFVWQQKPLPKAIKILGHISYALVILFGLHLLFKLPGIYPHWLLAKIVLFFVALSATFKSQRQTAELAQRKTGIYIAAVAYIALLGLIVIKPAGMLLLN